MPQTTCTTSTAPPTTSAAADRLIYRLVAERKVKFTHAGRSLRFWQSDLDTYLDARAVKPVGRDPLAG